MATGGDPKARSRARRRPAEPADRTLAITPSPEQAAADVTPAVRAEPRGDELDAAILRHLRRWPNRFVDLQPLADQLRVEPFEMQLAVEHLARRRMVTAPFIEPGTAGGAELTQVGLRWLIAREGGKPADVPVAFQRADGPVRAADEAARLPRAHVYGTRPSD